MSARPTHVRNGHGTVRPYVYGRPNLLEFVERVFGSVEVERNRVQGGFHVEARIGDSVVVLVAMDPAYAEATRASIYVYVPDVDASYARAITAGATSIEQPVDKPYDERAAAVKDSFGNVWYLAAYTGSPAR